MPGTSATIKTMDHDDLAKKRYRRNLWLFFAGFALSLFVINLVAIKAYDKMLIWLTVPLMGLSVVSVLGNYHIGPFKISGKRET